TTAEREPPGAARSPAQRICFTQEMASCQQCGLEHGPRELFVAHGDDALHPLVDTCELECALRAAHAAPEPVGSVAYHATPADLLDDVLTVGLDPAATFGTCKHVCFAPSPRSRLGRSSA